LVRGYGHSLKSYPFDDLAFQHIAAVTHECRPAAIDARKQVIRFCPLADEVELPCAVLLLDNIPLRKDPTVDPVTSRRTRSPRAAPKYTIQKLKACTSSRRIRSGLPASL
jgi:hypothetical protein